MPLTLPPLLADMSIPGHDFGIHSDVAPGSEAFVAMTLGFLVFLFLGFAIGGWVLWRRERHPSPHRRLLMELEAEVDDQLDLDPPEQPSTARDRPPPQPKPEPNPWERDGDWWKKG